MRTHNEDTIASDESVGFAILADGMGGYKAGEVASEIAVLSIAAELTEALVSELRSYQNWLGLADVATMQPEAKLLLSAVKNANNSIYLVSRTLPECEGMGTTLVVSLFVNNKLLVGHIGDSRMYRLRGGILSQLTEDHSLLQEQISAGLISPEQAKYAANKNLVTRALGVGAEVEPALQQHEVEVGDVYLMCSDGLSDLVDDQAIAALLNKQFSHLEESAKALVQMAKNNGGLDNISVILARVNQSFESVQNGGNHAWLRGSAAGFFGWLK